MLFRSAFPPLVDEMKGLANLAVMRSVIDGYDTELHSPLITKQTGGWDSNLGHSYGHYTTMLGDIVAGRTWKIGRTSCRERVSISVVAVALNKKKGGEG